MPSRGVCILLAMLFGLALVACNGGGGSDSSTPTPAITSGFGEAITIVVVSDGQAPVVNVVASHPDPAETLSFMIDGGADQALFSIDPVTGALDFTIAPDYANPTDADADNVYEVRVTVSDSAGAKASQTISVAVAFLVDTLADVVDGDLSAGNRSLREAIDFVFDGDAISFSASLAGQTLVLTAGQIAIEKNLLIDGDLDNDRLPDVMIDAGSLSRIFEFDDSSGLPDLDIRLSGLWLTNGMVTGSGGAILNRENLSVVDCILAGNQAMGVGGRGGAIASGPGGLTLQGTTVVGNSTSDSGGDGGGLSNLGGTLTLTSSVVAQNESMGSGSAGGGVHSDSGSVSSSDVILTVSKTDVDDNVSRGRGGGISVRQGSFTIEQSTIRYNQTTGSSADGGGIHSVTSNPSQNGTISNSTIHGNQAAGDGGGLFALFKRVRVLNSTVTSNMAVGNGGGIGSDEFDPDFGSRVEVASSIVASNAPDDVYYTTFFPGSNPFLSRGGNLVGSGNASDAFASSEIIGGADPELENLDFYGGETPTRPPLASSPAIGAGRNPERLRIDQRGEVRTFGGSTDAGAVERNDMD